MTTSNHKGWLAAVPLTVVLVLAIVIPQQLVTPQIGMSDPEIGIIFSLLELIALLLPALAIMLQVMIRFTERSTLVLTGEALEARQTIYGIVGFAGLACIASISVILAYLDISNELFVALSFAVTAVYVFAVMPLVVWNRLRDPGFRDVSQLIEGFSIYEDVQKVENFDDDELRTLVDAMDLEHSVNFGPDFGAQAELDDERFQS